MIRRKAAVMCTAVMLLGGAACSAEAAAVPSIRETVAAENTAFSFRNGVTWGMTAEQVQATEQTAMDKYSSGEWSIMITSEPVEVSRFRADLVFMFWQDTLQMITYEFQADSSGLTYQYLTGALCSVYGERSEADPAVIKGFMDRIYPDRYNLAAITQPSAWTAEDGTIVFQYYFSAQQFAILYIRPGSGQQGGGYVVKGL